MGNYKNMVYVAIAVLDVVFSSCEFLSISRAWKLIDMSLSTE